MRPIGRRELIRTGAAVGLGSVIAGCSEGNGGGTTEPGDGAGDGNGDGDGDGNGDGNGDGGMTTTAGTGDLTSVTIAASLYPNVLSSLPTLVAQEEGIFEDNGLSLEDVASFVGGGDTVRGIVTGDRFAGIGGLQAVYVAYSSGAPLNMIMNNVASPYLWFIAPPDSPIEGINDLAGNTVATTSPGGSSEAILKLSLSRSDISPDDVDVIYAGSPGSCWQAAQEGAADASFSAPPLQVQLVNSGEAKIIFESREYVPEYPLTGIQMGSQTIENRPDDAEAFAQTMIDAQNYITENVEASARVWAEAAEIEEGLAIDTLQTLDPSETYGISLTQEAVQSVGELLMLLGETDEQPAWGDIINQQPLPEEYRTEL